MEKFNFGYPESSCAVELFLDDGTIKPAEFKMDTGPTWVDPESKSVIPVGNVMGWRKIDKKED